jgi:hypothetical protein
VHTGISALFGLEEARNVLTKVKQFIWRPLKV